MKERRTFIKTSEVLRHFRNSQAEMARAFGVSRAAVNQWGRYLPDERAYQWQLMQLQKPAA